MKYQIYLSKEASEFINGASKQEGIKPATAIKRIVESLVTITLATQRETEKEIQKYGQKK